MATSGNRDWAYTEATRRAKVMAKPYAIYNHPLHPFDHIIRPAADEPPANWKRIAIILPDGTNEKGES